MTQPVIWNQLKAKHPEKKRKIPADSYTFKPEEEFQLKLDKILPKLDMSAAPGPAGLRKSHLRLWTGVYAPPSTDEVAELLELLVSNMANDNTPPWFMQTVHAADFVALAKAVAQCGMTGDHTPTQVPNTLKTIEDMAILQQMQAEYTAEMLPQQIGMGVKFAVELLVMGI